MNRVGKQRIVRAAKDDRVDIDVREWLQVSPGGKCGDLASDPTLFGERHEQGSRSSKHLHRLAFTVNCTLVRAGRNRARRREDADAPGPGRLDPGARTRLNDPDNRNVEARLELVERDSARRIARNDQQLDVEAQQALGASDGVLDHSPGAARPVWNPRRIAKIDQVLRGQCPANGAGHRKATQARVEDSNRLCHMPRVGQGYTTDPKEPPSEASLVGWKRMPTLALISKDSNLYRELVETLEGTAWSVEWLGPEAVDDSEVQQEVVVLDAGHPEMEAWRAPRGKPVLLIMEEGGPAGLNDIVDDLVFRPTRQDELLLRLERLRARTPQNHLRRQYAETFASMAPGIVVVGPDLTMAFANPRSYEIVGHRQGTISSDDIVRVVSPNDLPRIRDTLSQRQYPRGMDIELVRRDGTRIICSCSFAPLIGAENHTVISFEDVTDLRETERELIKTMEFLESLIDASVDAIIATDMEQRVVLFNPSAERVSGRHVSDVLGNVKLEDLLGRSSAELVTQRLLAPDHGGEGRLEPTMLDLLDLHGRRIPVQLSASLIYEHGEPSAIVLIFADLRDRIRVEERLAEAQKKLAFTEKQGVLAELAGTAAHELNQPLTSMMAYAELLLRQSEPNSTGAKTAEVLIREAERMAEIVRKIGKITRYETTAYVGHQKIFDLDRAADASGDPGAKS